MFDYRIVSQSLRAESKSNCCFVAGTLVHTDKGLVPIEQIKVGDKVLSKAESGLGEGCYKPVTKTFEFKDKEVWFVEFTNLFFWKSLKQSYNGSLRFVEECFISTPSHQFWVVGYVDQKSVSDLGFQEIVFLGKPFWSRLDDLRIGAVLSLSSGSFVAISSIQGLLETNDDAKGFIQGYQSHIWDEESYGRYVEFTANGFVAHTDGTANVFNERGKGAVVLRRKVYNFEVSDLHTYFIGACGVWVHDENSIDERSYGSK